MLSKHTRKFWTISKGHMIGYIDTVKTQGLFFSNKCIEFRETSSNMAEGTRHNLSLEECKTDKSTIRDVMDRKIPVIVSYHQQLFSFPHRGVICEQIYATEIKVIDNETLHVKKI